jgi:glycosyltransferase involved in cell wall biosynthesis
LDTRYWHDTPGTPKTRVLIYNKNQFEMTERIKQYLQSLNLAHDVLTYGGYTPDAYREKLRQATVLLWLSATETQGLAYLEALSMNVPVIAWDPGLWRYTSPALRKSFECPASSVPYFDARCGETFKATGDFPGAWQRFSERRAEYRPREFIFEQKLDLDSNLERLPLA